MLPVCSPHCAQFRVRWLLPPPARQPQQHHRQSVIDAKPPVTWACLPFWLFLLVSSREEQGALIAPACVLATGAALVRGGHTAPQQIPGAVRRRQEQQSGKGPPSDRYEPVRASIRLVDESRGLPGVAQ